MLVGGKAKRELAFGIHTILSGAVSLSFRHFHNSQTKHADTYFCRFNTNACLTILVLQDHVEDQFQMKHFINILCIRLKKPIND